MVALSGKMMRHWDFGVAVLILAGYFVYGVYCLTFVPKRAGEEMRVMVVQRNIPQKLNQVSATEEELYGGLKKTMEEAMKDLEREAVESLEEAGSAELPWPDLVVWPESAMPQPLWLDEGGNLYPGQSNEHFLKGDILSLGEFDLLAGSNIYTVNEETGAMSEEVPLYNGAFLIQSERPYEEMELYRKVHLVPFGETMPLVDTVPFFKWIFHQVSGVEYTGNFGSGEATEPMAYELNGEQMSLIPLVCFEDTVGRLTRKFVREEPQVIINITNDGWFNESEAAAQHFANAKFRAIELRRPMVRAANTGVSVVLQATGSEYGPAETKRAGERQMILDEDGSHFTQGWYEGYLRVPEAAAFSLYALWGDWFCYVGLGVMAVFWGWKVWRMRVLTKTRGL